MTRDPQPERESDPGLSPDPRALDALELDARSEGQPPPGPPWDLPVSRCPFALLDVEMTGLDPHRDAILEVAVTRLEGGTVTAALDTLVRTEVRSHPAALALHGVPTEALSEAPLFEAVAPALAALLEGAVPVAHGVALDVAFLDRAFESLGRGERLPFVLDTVTLARRALNARRYTLGALGHHLGLGAHRWHRAGEDVRALVALFQRLVPMFNPESARDLLQVRVGQRGAVEVRDAIARRLLSLARARGQTTLVVRTPGRDPVSLSGRVEHFDSPHVTLLLAPPRSGLRILRADRVLRIE